MDSAATPREDRSHRAEARRLIALAWPVILTNLNWTIMHMVDVLVVGMASTHEVGALGAARSIFFVVLVFVLGLLSAVLVFVSRADGARDGPLTGALYRQAIWLGLMSGTVAGAVTGLAGPSMLVAIGAEPGLAMRGGDVLIAMAIGLPGQCMLIAASYFLEGVSQPRRVMIVNLAMLPVNALLAAWFALGGPGLAPMGAFGAALATSLVSIAGAVAMAWMGWTVPDAQVRDIRRLDWESWRNAIGAAWALLRFGLVPGLGAAMEVVGFSWVMIVSTWMGDVTAAAFQGLLSLHNIGYALALGLGSAAGVRVGNAVGAGERDQAVPRTMIACALSLVAMGALVLVYKLFPLLLAGVISPDPAVAREIALMLAILAPFILCDGVQAIFMYALRSLGDQIAAGVNGMIGFFAIMAIAGTAAWHFDMGARGLAIAAALGMASAALLQGGRFWWISAKIRRN